MKKNMKRILAVAGALVLAIGLLAACVTSGGGETPQGSGAAAPTGDLTTLRFGVQMYSDGLIDPMAQVNTCWNCMRFGIGECLFKFDDNMVPQPWLAESAETEDYITWVVTLKSGIKFSDGCDMTASKVLASFQRMKDEGPNGSTAPQKYVPYETEITADDAANTITFVLPKADVNFKGKLAHPACEICDVEDTKDWNNAVIGTGPYMAESFQDQVGYTMKANPYYYDEVPYETVEIMFMGDASAKAMALQSGQVDLVENITNVSDIKTLQDDPNFTVDIASGVRCGFAWMNFKGVLANDTIRQAIQMAVDHETICQSNTIGGLYTAGYSVLPATLSYGYDKLNNPYPYDVDAANKLLDDAGIKDTDGDGIRELNGQNIVLTFVSYENRLLNDFSDAFTMYLTEIGIGVKADYGSSDDQWNKLVAGEYDLNNNNWTTVATGDPTEYMANWYSKAESNYCGYASAEYDALYEEYLSEFDEAKRAELLQKMQQILIDDAVVLVDGYYNSSMIYSKNVGYAHIHTADYYWLTTEITPAK